MGCEDCSIRKMLREGCCTQDVGLGTKTVKVDGGKKTIEVCIYLSKDFGGAPYCSNHGRRPPICKAFFCESEYAKGMDSTNG